MFRSILVAALRNLFRNRLLGAIGMLGLAIGFATLILVGLYVFDQYHFDRFLPNPQDVFRLSSSSRIGPAGANAGEDVRGPIADQFRARFPQVLAIAELWNTFGTISVRRGAVEAREPGFTWADPAVFDVLPFPAAGGDLHAALSRPDGLVLTRRMARKYFGRDLPLGETLEVDHRRTLRVAAVLEDLPTSTHLNTELFGSSLALQPIPAGNVYRAFVYVRFAPGTRVDAIRADLNDFTDSIVPAATTGRLSEILQLRLTPITAIHLESAGRSPLMRPGVDPQRLTVIAEVAAVVLLLAIINFVNLMTARASRRATEVCVRKAAGATRSQLALQFTGEAILHSALAMLLALGFVELALPAFAGFLDSDLRLDYLQPLTLPVLVGLVVAVGVIAGAYPAFLLSSFKPARVLKGLLPQGVWQTRLRELLVLVQFSVLIVLLLAVVVLQLQTRWAIREGLRFDQTGLLTVHMADDCEHSQFRSAVSALAGVAGTACEGEFLTNVGTQRYRRTDGVEVTLQNTRVGTGLFELLGLSPLAGRFFDAGLQAQGVPDRPALRDLTTLYPAIVNESAVHALGYASASAAIGGVFVSVSDVRPGTRRQIVGVVPDIGRDSVRFAIAPTFYDASPGYMLNVRLKEPDASRTLDAIEALWRKYAPAVGPIEVRSYDQFVASLYADLRRQGLMISVLTAVAIALAGVGLFGLAAFTVDRRMHEMGLRKALGARGVDLMRLLLWQFARPIFWANLLAWPLAAWILSSWLRGFAYRIDLPLWPFPAAALAAGLIMLATVGTHVVNATRMKPVQALRYE